MAFQKMNEGDPVYLEKDLSPSLVILLHFYYYYVQGTLILMRDTDNKPSILSMQNV